MEVSCYLIFQFPQTFIPLYFVSISNGILNAIKKILLFQLLFYDKTLRNEYFYFWPFE